MLPHDDRCTAGAYRPVRHPRHRVTWAARRQHVHPRARRRCADHHRPGIGAVAGGDSRSARSAWGESDAGHRRRDLAPPSRSRVECGLVPGGSRARPLGNLRLRRPLGRRRGRGAGAGAVGPPAPDAGSQRGGHLDCGGPMPAPPRIRTPRIPRCSTRPGRGCSSSRTSSCLVTAPRSGPTRPLRDERGDMLRAWLTSPFGSGTSRLVPTGSLTRG